MILLKTKYFLTPDLVPSFLTIFCLAFTHLPFLSIFSHHLQLFYFARSDQSSLSCFLPTPHPVAACLSSSLSPKILDFLSQLLAWTFYINFFQILFRKEVSLQLLTPLKDCEARRSLFCEKEILSKRDLLRIYAMQEI